MKTTRNGFVIWRTDNAYCRTYTGVSVWYRYTQSLKNCYTPLIPDRPYREMRWSDERKDKRCVHKRKILHFLKMALFVVALSLILLSLLGTVAHATGLVDDTINAENLYSKYPLSNYQLDFMWIIAGRGCRGTGWTVSENRYSTGFTALPILSGR